MNLDKWKAMTPQQRDFIQKMAMEVEANSAYWRKEGEDEKKKQTAAGIQPLTFGATETAKYLDAVYEAGWADLIKSSPVHGPKLRALLSRNVEISGFPRGFPASNDISEYALYLCTLLGAPWLPRAGQHIRVDIVLRAIPPRLAYGCEWLSDVMAFAGCVALAWMGVVMTFKSYASGAIQIKSVVIPEWWVMAPLPIAFALLAIEFAFRMWRLAHGPKEPRSDAVSAA